MENEAMETIEMLYSMISEARRMPLAADKVIVERDAILGMLEELRDSLPVEISEAKRLLSAKDEFISNAKREAEQIRKTAEDKARALVEEEEIVKIAKLRSAEITSNTEQKCAELRKVANEYVDDTMRRTEEAIMAALEEVRKSRTSFRSAASAATAAPAQPAARTDDEEVPAVPRTPQNYDVLSADEFDDE
ncbi:MAG: hypothetical protein UEE32_02005 [Oscillospiraceae bacterium]|nr:hypothetical protein [Oscillospiraceae bacterium]